MNRYYMEHLDLSGSSTGTGDVESVSDGQRPLRRDS
jgi:hypothetical protein